MNLMVQKEDLQQVLQGKLNDRLCQAPHLHLDILDLSFDEGFWRAVVRPRNAQVGAGDYAHLLAEVEEEVLKELGFNIVFVPSN